MTAEGKKNAANIQAGDRIMVTFDAESATGVGTDGLYLARIKRNAVPATVTKVEAYEIASGGFSRRASRRYILHTDQGPIRNLAPIQTMTLAPAATTDPATEVTEVETGPAAEVPAAVPAFIEPAPAPEALAVIQGATAVEDAGKFLAALDEWAGADQPAALPQRVAQARPAPAGSAVVRALEHLWSAIRINHAELPDVVIVTGSGLLVGPPRWGHFRADGWTELGGGQHGEMFVSGEILAKGATHTLQTVLHEAAHVLCRARGVQDTSRQGRWHNGLFRKAAEELGLEYLREAGHKAFGFSEVTLVPGTVDLYASALAELDRAIRLTVSLPEGMDEDQDGDGERVANPHGGGRRKREDGAESSSLKLVCACESPRILRLSRKSLDAGPILCGACHEVFALAS
jgi:hypothetical protein